MILRGLLLSLFSITVLAALPSFASADDSEELVYKLTEENIVAFLEESRTMAFGVNPALTESDIKEYFKRHLAEKGEFKSKTRYELPGYPPQNSEVKLDKETFISNVLGGEGLIKDYKTSISVKKLKISHSKKSATIETTSTESGTLLWPYGPGGEEEIPVEGTSDCEQRLIVSLTNYIQVAEADCDTRISFSPFLGKPLGE